MKHFDLGIVGAGASGLAAAIAASEKYPGYKIALFDRLPRVGKKILATGNGRCNLTNINALAHGYRNKSFASAALNKYPPESVMGFFKRIGLYTFIDCEGRVYPRSNSANSVLDSLRYAAEKDNISVFTETPVGDIIPGEKSFTVNGEYICDKIILAGGGKSSPSQGSDGSALKLARSLGHRVTQTVPALVPLNSRPDKVKSLKGIRASGVALTLEGEREDHASFGEILFTDTGVSGIAAMELAAAAERELRNAFDPVLHIDFLPEENDIKAIISDILYSRKNQPLENLLSGLLPKQLGIQILKNAGVFDPSGVISPDYFSDNMIDLIVGGIKDFKLEVLGTRGFANSQVTSGGVDINEIDPETLESLIVPGLYFSGEIIDVDGGCGGFNLQWAFASGLLAGELNDKNK